MTDNDYLQNSRNYYNTRFGQSPGEHHKLSDDEIARWSEINASVEKFIIENPNTELSILDFGCGRGWISNLLSKFGKVTGVDLAEDAIAYAKKQYPIIDFICLDASSGSLSTLKDKKFDLVISTEVIEHVKDQKAYINNISYYLKPRGRLILTTPNGIWLDEWFAGERNSYRQPYEFWLTKADLTKLCKSDFRNINVKSFYSDWLFINKTKFSNKIFVNKLSHKLARKLGFYESWKRKLNNKNYGLYLILNADRYE